MDNHLLDIISDIKKENCILILGPDIIDLGQKSFFETMFDEFLNDAQYKSLIDITPQYVFTNEDLVQLQPNAKETTVLRMMERFYQRQKAFDEPLTKISRIPFHLIISLMPDDRLQSIFKAQNLDCSYSHFPREEPPVPVEKPTYKKPLIYNLLGDFNESDVIITFDHLFTFLSGIMGKRELPQNIQEALKKARTFIFLGVHFEKWYVQLLLRIITSKDKREKYTILKNGNTNDVCTFIARRLELDFLPEEPIDFLDELYNECKTQSLLKTTARIFISYSHKDKTEIQKLVSALKQSNIEVVIDDNDMRGGEKIDDFISTIKDVDIIIPVISSNSLLSTWVIKEIHTSLVIAKKRLLPCYLDKSFEDKDFIDNAQKIVNDKIQNIGSKIMQRGSNTWDDLISEKKELDDYSSNLPFVLNEIKGRKCISLAKDEFDGNMAVVINEITTLMKQK